MNGRRIANERAVRARLRTALGNVEGCLHPNAPNGCTAIIRAHSLQRNGPLAHLKDEGNHVYTFSPGSSAFFRTDPDRVGWKDASTFRGLCQAHDAIFGPIENVAFSGSPDQVFLVGYRASYLEIHEKRATIAACDSVGYAQMASMRPMEMDERSARRILRYQQWGRRKGLKDLGGLKTTLDSAWRAADFSAVSSCVVHFDGGLSVASAGMVSPDYTVSGERLQDLHLPGTQSLAFGTIATPQGGAIVFIWPKEMSSMSRFVHSLVSLPEEELPGALLLFMFSYVSNTFFRPAWWKGLRASARVRLSEAGRTVQQYYTPVNYRIGPVVDWRIVKIDFNPRE